MSTRILVIEDAIVAQMAEVMLLESLGCDVETASTGREAIIKTHQAQDYDLIFLDLGLPDIDALTVTEAIRTNYAKQAKKAPPIIALTAHAYESLQEECQRAGMSDFLAKPLTQDIAEKLLKTYVN